MKKSKMIINEYKKTKCSYTITLENVRFAENGFKIIEKIIKHFIVSDKLFLGFYRTDGINITSKQFKEYEKEIKDLEKNLSIKYNKNVTLNNIVDKTILGGVLVKLGNEEIDGTVKTRLSKMKKQLSQVIS